MTRPAINILTLHHVTPYLAKSGVDVVAFMHRLGISPNVFLQSTPWFDRATVFEIANAMAEVTGNRFAGAFAGHDIPVPGFGKWGAIVSQSESLEQACRLMVKNIGMMHRGSAAVIRHENSGLQVRFAFQGRLDNDPLQVLLGSIAVMKNVAILAGEAGAVRVHLKMPWTFGARHLDECFGARIAFGSSFDGVEIDSEALGMELHTSPRKDASTVAIDTTIAAAVLIHELMPTGRTSIELVAHRYSLSVRTLQRRLKYCGVRFEDLLDVSRRDEALSQIEAGASDMADLALRLGYSHPANFTRAFRRWTGQTPSRYAGSA